MDKQPSEILREGRRLLDPVLSARGVSSADGQSGKGSGDTFACGAYVNGDRKLVHYRYSLGLVTYRFAGMSLDHACYRRAVLGNAGGNKYPGFADASLDAFRDLAHDLQSFAQAFLDDDATEFARYMVLADDWEKRSGFARLNQ
jgi:hypothetical protein